MGAPFHLRLGANESLFGPSPRALAAMQSAAVGGYLYNDPEGFDLRSEIARVEEVSLENVCLGAGIDDLLLLTCRAFLQPGRVAVTSLGGYPTFNYAVAGCGGSIYSVAYRSDAVDVEGLAEAAQRTGATLVYLANPDNPSGSFASRSSVEGLRSELPAGCLLILDEAYADFVPRSERPVFDPEDPQVVRMRTFSKAHGMAGLRVGYALGPSSLMGLYEKIRLHFAVNIVAQAGALASLRDPEHVARVVGQMPSIRDFLSAECRKLGLSTLPSFTNFVNVDLGSPERSLRLLQELQRRGVFVRRPFAEPLNRCIRVTLAPIPTMQAFILELEAALGALGS